MAVSGAGILFVAGVGLAVVLHAGVLLVAALAAGLRRSIEEDFYIGVGKNDRPDVAAFHDHAAAAAEIALEFDHPRANVGMNADARGSLGNVGIADAFGDVGAVEKDTIAVTVGFEADIGVTGETLERECIVEVVVGEDRFQGEGAIHGAGFEIEKAEVLGEMPGDGALAGASGAVNGDDGAACHSGFSS